MCCFYILLQLSQISLSRSLKYHFLLLRTILFYFILFSVQTKHVLLLIFIQTMHVLSLYFIIFLFYSNSLKYHFPALSNITFCCLLLYYFILFSVQTKHVLLEIFVQTMHVLQLYLILFKLFYC
jgi:hypothetical protein